MTGRTGMAIVPVALRVEGRSVLVVGAGRIAARKAAPLVAAGAEVTVVAPEHTPAMDAVPVTARRRRPFTPDDLEGVRLVITATGDPTVDGAVFAEAERRRVWCNAADDPAHCSVILPAVTRRHGVTVAISTGGRSPAVASWLRRRIDALLDDTTGTVIDVATAVREQMRAAGRPTEVPGWADVLDNQALALAAAGRRDDLERAFTTALGLRPDGTGGPGAALTTPPSPSPGTVGIGDRP
ncbi:MAG: bifunctional precorrin-2 dehydrogenase/sirohydrochlorin ferrochelatase [Acidimicrobiales bacterium]